MINSILLILFYCSLSVAYQGTPVVWDRIPQFKVNDRVTSFLNKQSINNCYEYEENSNNLHLKCWIDNELVNVDISMYKNEESFYI